MYLSFWNLDFTLKIKVLRLIKADRQTDWWSIPFYEHHTFALWTINLPSVLHYSCNAILSIFMHASCFTCARPSLGTQLEAKLWDRSWYLNTILHSKKPGLLREVAESRSRAGKVQDETGASFCARKYWIMGTYPKDTGASSKGLLLPQTGTI